MSPRPLRRRAFRVLAAALVAAAAGGVATGTVAAAATTTKTATLVPSDDAYVQTDALTRNTGASDKLVASTVDGVRKTALLKVAVPSAPSGAVLVAARLELTAQRDLPPRVALHRLTSSTFTEATVTQATAPALGAVVAEVAPPSASRRLSFDVSSLVKSASTLAVALSAPSGTAALNSTEASTGGPRLVITYTVPTEPPPPATTLFGACIWPVGGESYATALQRSNTTYGKLEVVRTFYPGLPAAWPGPAGANGGTVNVSFKAAPSDVVSGRHDAFFTTWFAAAPRDRDIYWTFYHEPEDNVERGEFTAADWRSAVRRLDGLADAAGNPRLRSTPVLMGWTLDPASRRTWSDYYPGADVVDVLGWDVYNLSSHKGLFDTPDAMFGRVLEASRTTGKPYGISEFGSLMVAGDDGSRRAAWLRDSATYLRAHGALFVAYFDAPVGPSVNPEYRLLDAPSQEAWRWAVSGS